MVRQLVAAGADLSLSDKKGLTALAHARENQSKRFKPEEADEVIAALVAAGARE